MNHISFAATWIPEDGWVVYLDDEACYFGLTHAELGELAAALIESN